MAEKSSYAKEFASVAIVELKNLVEEVTKLSFQTSKLSKELAPAQETLSVRVLGMVSIRILMPGLEEHVTKIGHLRLAMGAMMM